MKFLNIIILLIGVFSFNANAITCEKVKFYDGEKTKAVFNVRYARTQEEKKRGLMFIKELPENQGELFVWEDYQQRFMWMKNTFISLDMIYIKDNTVVGIIKNTTPESLRTLTVPVRVNMVLEINGGLSEKYDIKTGDYFGCSK